MPGDDEVDGNGKNENWGLGFANLHTAVRSRSCTIWKRNERAILR